MKPDPHEAAIIARGAAALRTERSERAANRVTWADPREMIRLREIDSLAGRLESEALKRDITWLRLMSGLDIGLLETLEASSPASRARALEELRSLMQRYVL